MNRNRINAMLISSSLLLTLPACKEKEEPPPEPAPTEQTTKASSSHPSPNPESSTPSTQSSSPVETSPPSVDDESASTNKPMSSPRPPSSPLPPASSPTKRTPSPSPSIQTGSTDRDGDVSLVALAKSLTTAIDRAGRAFKAKDADSALTEAIRARRSIPSPATIEAMGKAAGPNGVIVAKRIEAMRRKLDQALDRLDQAGAGDAPSVMKQDVVIE